MKKKILVSLLSLWILLVCGSAITHARTVTFVLKDQGGNEIPGSAFYIPSLLEVVPTGTSVEIADGNYAVQVRPGIGGVNNYNLLHRTDQVTIDANFSGDFEWITMTKTMNVNDQTPAPIPGSAVYVSIGPGYLIDNGTDGIFPVTDNTYSTIGGLFADGVEFQVRPGIGGVNNYFLLHRLDKVEIDADFDGDFEWITMTETMNVNDQTPAPIPGSAVYVSIGPGYLIDNGTDGIFPVTDNTYSTIGGLFADGVEFQVRPGIGGVNNYFLLHRLDKVEIDANFTGDFEWITMTETMNVNDQTPAPIPGSAVYVPIGGGYLLDNGVDGTFPITETQDPEYDTIAGDFADGITFQVRPGISGVNDFQILHRKDDVEIDANFTGDFEWITVQGPLYVVDSTGIDEVAGSSYTSYLLGSYQTGDVITVPVTDNNLYDTIGGIFSDGYDITIDPGDQTGNAQYSFDFYADYSIWPQFVNINDSQYGLRFQVNNAPVVDAGPAVSLLSAGQSSTVIVGNASDLDGDSLFYRWLEDAAVLLDSTPLLADGTAPLDLSTLSPISIGEHEFTLEVTDGTATISADTVVTVNNSEPTAVPSGGGTYEVGTDVTLAAEVADYDGDRLSYEWREGNSVLTDGTVDTVFGGFPVAIPDYVISGLEIGTHELTLEVTDEFTTPVLDNATVKVIDETAPTLSPIATSAILWPPNHTMADVTIQANASDNSGGTVTLTADVYSSEPPETDGDGNAVPDFTQPQIDQNTGEITLQLRSERSGKGDGRTYTIMITATDESDNTSTTEVKIVAPHNKAN